MSKPTSTRVLLRHTLALLAKRVFVVFLVLVSLTSVYSITRTGVPRVQAAAPATLNFQARLLTSSGTLVPDGIYNVEFKIYNASTSSGSSQGSCTGDANCLWTETRLTSDPANQQVSVKNGYLSAYLGDKTALPANIWNQQLWLTMNIGGTTGPTWDGEMSPRIRLTSVPFAFRAAIADSAETLSKNTGSFTGTAEFATMTADRKFLFPDTALATTASPGTICVYNGAASNCPAASGSSFYIQNTGGSATPQTAANINIQATNSGVNGTVAAILRGAAAGQTVDLLQFQATGGTVLGAVTAAGNLQVASTVDTYTAGTLTIGGSNATGVTLGQNTTVAATKSLTVTSGATNLTGLAAGSSTALSVTTGATNNVGLLITGVSSQSADLLQVKANGVTAPLLSVSATGTTVLQNSTDSSSALSLKDAGGENNIVAGTTDLNTNLISNPSFESGVTGWSAKGGAGTPAQTSAQKLYDSNSLSVVTSAVANQGVTFDVSLAASTAYSFTAYVRSSTASASVFTLGRQDIAGTDVNCTGNGLNQAVANTGWTKITCTFTTGGTITPPSRLYLIQTDATARTIYVDGVTLVAGTQTGLQYGQGTLRLNSIITSPLSIAVVENTSRSLEVVNASGTSVFSIDTTSNNASISGAYISSNTSGSGLSATSISTGNGANIAGTTFTTGNGILFNATANALTSGKGINITGAASAITADFSGQYINVTPTRTLTAAATRTDSGNFLNLTRANTVNNAAGIYNVTGALANLQSTCTQTSGTCNDSGVILNLNQQYGSSTGAVLNVTGAGTGNLGTFDATNASANGVLIDVQSASASQYIFKTTSNNGATTAFQVNADGSISQGVTGTTTTVNGALTVTQAATFNGGVSVASNFTVTNAGNVAFQRNTTDISATPTLNDLSLGTGALFRFTGATTQTLTSIANPADGRVLTLINAAAQALVIQNDSGGTAANRIITGTGSDVSIPAGASIQLTYDSGASRWRVVGGSATSGGGANQQLSNLSGTVAINASLTPNADNTLDLGSSANSWRTLYSDTSVVTPLIDTASAVALNIGTTNANAINLNQNTTVAATKSLTVTSGATSLTGLAAGSSTALSITTGATTNVGLLLTGVASQTADILQVKANGVATSLVSVSSSGQLALQNATDSSTAFTFKDAAGENNIVAGTTDLNTNLISNPSFESGVTGWSAKGGAGTPAQSSAQKIFDNNSMSVATTGANQGATLDVSLAASTAYSFTAYVRSSTAAASVLTLGRQDIAGTDANCTGNGLNQSLANSGWVKVTCTFTTGATITPPSRIYLIQTDATARTIYIDGVTLVAGTQTALQYGQGTLKINSIITSPLMMAIPENTQRAIDVVNSTGVSIFNLDTINGNVNLSGSYVSSTNTGSAFSAGSLNTGNGANLSGTSFTTGNGILFNTTSNGLTSGNAIDISGAASAITADATGHYVTVAPSRTLTAAATRTDTAQLLNLARANTVNNAGGTFNVQGDVANFSSNCTQTSGSCADNSNILELSQQYASASGAVLNVLGAGTGNLGTFDTTNTSANGVSIDMQSSSASQYVFKTTSNNGATTSFQVNGDGSLSVGVLGATTTINGNITVGATAGSGTTFTNNGATVATTLALTNFNYTGSGNTGGIGSAASTVDIYSSISINQTQAPTQTLTLPSPTANTVYGRIVYISNVGTASFTLLGSTLNPGATATVMWSNISGGASWVYAGADAGGIQNQNTADQSANFRINGTGRANTALQAPLFDTATAVALGIGTTNATNITLGHNAGTLAIDQTNFDLSTAGVLTLAGGQTNDITTQTNQNLTLQANGSGTIVLNDTVTTAGTMTFSGVATDITTGTNEDLTVVANGTGTIVLNDTVTAAGTLTFSGVATDLTTGTNEDLTVVANGTGTIVLNDTVTVAGTMTYSGVATDITTGTNEDLVIDANGTGVTQVNDNFRIGASAGSGTTLTNNGATVATTLALTNFNYTGSGNTGGIGSAASTVDIYTSISVAQSTAAQTLTIPTPTANTTYGRLLYISNIGTTRFTVLGTVINQGATATLMWSNTSGGASWVYAGADAGGIQNQNTSQQASANFWISGSGRADTSLLTPLLDTATGVALAIGTTNATQINLNKNTIVAAGQTFTVTSALTSLTGATSGDALNVNNSTSTGNIAVFQDNGSAVLTIADGGGITGTGTYTFSGVATDITTGTNQDLTVVANGSGTIILNDTVTANGTLTFSGVATDITTATNEDLTVVANGTGTIVLNDTVTVAGTVTYSNIATDITTGTNEDLVIDANGTGVTQINDNFRVGASAGSGTTFTNNGSTVASTLALTNFNYTGSGNTGSLGSAASTVDVYTSISVNQTQAPTQTLTIPTPTANTAYGRIVYLSNIGTTAFNVLNSTLNPGATATIMWANTNGGAAWVFAGADGTSINNQKAAAQNGDFWIQAGGSSTGIGRADGGLQAPSLERASNGTLSLGSTSTTTAITMGSTSLTGNLNLDSGTSSTIDRKSVV